MLTLTSFVDILQNVALNLHVTVCTATISPSIVLNLVNKSVEVIILGSWIVSGRSMLVALHSTLIVLHIQIESILV